jgi:hypothetical protein
MVYRFKLPKGDYRALRFDPINREAIVTFSGAKILDADGKIIKNISASQFKAVKQRKKRAFKLPRTCIYPRFEAIWNQTYNNK